MRTAGLSIAGTILSLQATGAYAQGGAVCSSRQLGKAGNSGLKTTVGDLATKLCNNQLNDKDHTPFIHYKGPEGIVLTITHSVEHPNHPATENCVANFNKIVEQCIAKDVAGGTVEVDGLLYEILQDNAVSARDSGLEEDEDEELEARDLEARGKKPGKKSRHHKKPGRKTRKRKGKKPGRKTKGRPRRKSKGRRKGKGKRKGKGTQKFPR